MAGSIDTYVVDASFILKFLLPDEIDGEVENVFDRLLDGKIKLISPVLLSFEVHNALGSAVKQKRIERNLAYALSEKFQQLRIQYKEGNLKDALDITLEKNLSFYDASYVALARMENLPLLTLDKTLKRLL